MLERPAFTIGIEEEYLVVDRETRDLIKSPPPEMWNSINDVVGSAATHEFLKAQIEIRTDVCAKVSEAREQVANCRRDLNGIVGEYGAAIIAASTHPFANWAHQETTEDDRYLRLAADFQQVARPFDRVLQGFICLVHPGCHLHRHALITLTGTDVSIRVIGRLQSLLLGT